MPTTQDDIETSSAIKYRQKRVCNVFTQKMACFVFITLSFILKNSEAEILSVFPCQSSVSFLHMSCNITLVNTQ